MPLLLLLEVAVHMAETVGRWMPVELWYSQWTTYRQRILVNGHTCA